MAYTLTKISLFLVVLILFISCNAVKRVPEGKFLLTENTITVDGNEISDFGVYSQLYQKPNPRIPLINVPLGLHIYNIAEPKPDSTFQDWLHRKPNREERLVKWLSKKQVDALDSAKVGFNNWLKKTGDAPAIISEDRTEKSKNRLKRYYSSYGWFNAEVADSIRIDTTRKKRASMDYYVTRNTPYIVDSITEKISSPVVDSLFQLTKGQSFIQSGKQYKANDFVNERDRLTIQFRNSGLYYFDQDYVGFEGDTVKTNHKANITYLIPDRKITVGDTVYTEPFKVHTVSEVRVVTDYEFNKRNEKFSDSAFFKGYKLYSYDELEFTSKAITDAISITPNKTFKDIDRTLSYNQLSDLRMFRYPNITYQEDPRDTTGTNLIATILLTPKKKYTLGADFDAYTSSIQQIGIGGSGTFLIRNVFRGAETLEISGNGSIGSSKDQADSDSKFFNVSDIGGEVKLSFPKILFPVNTDKLIPKYMSPTTSISLGFNAQNNIGLDRQSINVRYNYRWKPSKIRTNVFDFLNIQYVRNLNVSNYFNIYRNSFDQVNTIARIVEDDTQGAIDPDYYTLDSNGDLQLTVPNGIDNFLNDAFVNNNYDLSNDNSQILQNNIERKDRLTEDNLIFTTSFTWQRDTREGISDNNFSRIRWKLESAGNLLSLISKASSIEKNSNDNYETLGVVFSQYLKGEAEYIKHWEFENSTIFAIRGFGGIAIPYGNSNSIPFTRSYFAGGANDNRGWRAYDLGPGSSGGVFEFNEANLKLAFNAEYRFPIFGAFKGALFVDAGNIWNVADNVNDEASKFSGLSDLKEIAIASGLGLRYDFGFFVFRLDTGFKTYNPANSEGNRWFKDYNFQNVVYNIGINYPF
ncbi:translocation and assembly module lipoprotein TamL [Cochleicola gelatinilyticus]|uniref:Uncharacterized protein n=1 Tax=Cochleicola gelatinilyticus TaxID=1763537 RepID=A0A167F2A4_9FLAO|nr:BamA/TamA family outer membrane protein [Cochleicola gelatinilyticus]OAB76115.1 hypothetical protein ULVI_13745 [Cochleicola gelatinilyticus]